MFCSYCVSPLYIIFMATETHLLIVKEKIMTQTAELLRTRVGAQYVAGSSNIVLT